MSAPPECMLQRSFKHAITCSVLTTHRFATMEVPRRFTIATAQPTVTDIRAMYCTCSQASWNYHFLLHKCHCLEMRAQMVNMECMHVPSVESYTCCIFFERARVVELGIHSGAQIYHSIHPLFMRSKVNVDIFICIDSRRSKILSLTKYSLCMYMTHAITANRLLRQRGERRGAWKTVARFAGSCRCERGLNIWVRGFVKSTCNTLRNSSLKCA